MDWVYTTGYGLARLVITAVIAYSCGCLNGAIIISKYILRDDIRTHGSGNAGLTNFHRTFGGKLTAVVLLLDVVKMVVAVWVGIVLACLWFHGSRAEELSIRAEYWTGLWCLLGHMFPVTFDFKGGKGVLSGVTLMFCLDWRMGLIAMGIFLVVVVLTRYISLGSCLASLSFPVGTWFFVSREPLIVGMAVALTALVIFMHRGNIKRIAAGNESKFSLHRKGK